MRKQMMTLACLVLGSLSWMQASAQDYVERSAYQEEAGELAMLYRGRQGIKYQFSYNGTYYWDGTEFGTGDVFYHGKLYRGVRMNVDAVQQQLLVAYTHTITPVALPTEEVLWFTIDGRRFDNLVKQGHEEMRAGFYEVIGEADGCRLYKANFKTVTNSVENVNGNTIGYDDPNYRSNVYTYFAYKPQMYFMDAQGRIIRLRSRRSIFKQFPGRARDLRRQAHAELADTFRPTLEKYCATVMKIAAQ